MGRKKAFRKRRHLKPILGFLRQFFAFVIAVA
jgi:hypothetical protein